MKANTTFLLATMLFALSSSSQAGLVLFHNFTEATWNVSDDGVSNDEASEEFTSTYTGTYYSFDVIVTATSSTGTLLHNTAAGLASDLAIADGEKITFSAVIANLTPLPGTGISPNAISSVGIAFQTTQFAGDNGGADSGTVFANGNSAIWADNNDGVSESGVLSAADPFSFIDVAGFPSTTATPMVLNTVMIDRTGTSVWRPRNVTFTAMIMIPEPSRAILLLLGMAGIILRRRR